MSKTTITGITLSLLLLSLFLFMNSQLSESTQDLRFGLAEEPLAALVVIANKKGYFIEQGINPIIQSYKGGKQALVDGLLANQVDLATTADVPIVFNTFQANDFKVVASIASSDNEPQIIARKDSNVLKPYDLYGKDIATKKASAVHFFLNVFLAHNTLHTEHIKLLFHDNGQQMVRLLADGEIDAFSHREPFISEAKKLLGDNAIIFQMPGAYTKTFNLVVRNDLAEQQPELIQRALKALLMAEEYVKTHPADSIKLVANFIGVKEDTLIKSWANTDFKVSLEKSLISTLEAQAHWAISSHLTNVTEVPSYLEHIDPSFLQAISSTPIGIEIMK